MQYLKHNWPLYRINLFFLSNIYMFIYFTTKMYQSFLISLVAHKQFIIIEGTSVVNHVVLFNHVYTNIQQAKAGFELTTTCF